jgi:molecular chaperone GrpE
MDPIAPDSEPSEETLLEATSNAEESTDGNNSIHVDQLQNEIASLKDQLLRLTAEFQNYKRRSDAEKDTIRRYAAESVGEDLLPVLDNFERTIRFIEAGAGRDKTVEGLKAVDRQFRNVLEQKGIKRIDALGKPFDPEQHEALGMVQNFEYPSNTVAEEVEPGYVMYDRILRPSKVRVEQ